MKILKRVLIMGALAGAVPLALAPLPAAAQAPAAAGISEDQLGQMIAALGLQPEKREQRYDFAFQAQLDDQTWELSMSAVLSQDGSSLWLMAWLDELPKASADVPRTALLRMLAQNDQLGDGKFFAYIPNNRRFVLQRSVANQDLTSAQIRLLLQDLGTSVAETYPVWAVSNWNGTPAAPTGQAQAPSVEAAGARSASSDSKFEQPIRR